MIKEDAQLKRMIAKSKSIEALKTKATALANTANGTEWYIEAEELCPECNVLNGEDIDCNTCYGVGTITVKKPKYTVEEISVIVDDYLEDTIKTREDASRKATLDTLNIEHHTVVYGANGKAIGNMSAVVALAGFRFNQAISQGMRAEDAYKAIYKDTSIYWKGATNELHEVIVESVCEVLEKSMLKVAEVIGAK